MTLLERAAHDPALRLAIRHELLTVPWEGQAEGAVEVGVVGDDCCVLLLHVCCCNIVLIATARLNCQQSPAFQQELLEVLVGEDDVDFDDTCTTQPKLLRTQGAR